MKLFFFVIIRYLDVNFTHPDPPIKSFTKKKGGGEEAWNDKRLDIFCGGGDT